jgi:hypothetical protein
MLAMTGCLLAVLTLLQADPLAPSRLPAPAREGPKDGIAARINNEILTWKDVDDTLKFIKPADLTPELRRRKLVDLAEERLFLQAAKQHSLTVSEQELDDVLRRERKNFKTDEDFERYIRTAWTTMTEYREGKRRAYLQHKLFRFLIQKSFTNPDDKTPGLLVDYVPPEEIRKYYDANRDRFKAIDTVTVTRIGLQYANDREEAAKRAILESVLRKLEEGTDFLYLAFYYSEMNRATKDLGHRDLSREEASVYYAPETVKLLFDGLKPGDLSGIVKDRTSINVFRLEQRVQQKEESFEDLVVQGKIRTYLENQQREKNRKRLRAHLVKSAYVWPPDLFEGE